MKYFFAIFFCCCTVQQSYAQHIQPMDIQTLEDSIGMALTKLRTVKSDGERDFANILLKKWLEKTLWRKEAFDHPFSSLKSMGTITSPDHSFRLFNWNIENKDGTQSFHCYVVKISRAKSKNTVIPLVDKSADMRRKPEDLALDNTKWYGCLYYDIIPVRKGSKQLYTLLAWDGNNRLSTKKMIDVLYFQGSKKVKLGYPIFYDGQRKTKRYFLEYTSEQFVSLKHLKKKKEDFIVFDHLSPKAAQLEGIYEHYVADGSYDAFQLDNGIWKLQQDVQQGNPKQKGTFNDPLKNNYSFKPKIFKKEKK